MGRKTKKSDRRAASERRKAAASPPLDQGPEEIVPAAEPAAEPEPAPETTVAVAEPAPAQTVAFSLGPAPTINGVAFVSSTSYAASMPVGSVIEYTLSGVDLHPFHNHVNSHRD